MKIFYIVFVLIAIGLIIYFIFGVRNNQKSEIISKGGNMKIESSNFQNNNNLPDKYTCKGEGTAPELFWSDYPDNTQSFAIIMEDPDAPGGTFTHWVLYNIPGNITSIPEGSTTLIEATSAKNSGGKNDYYPPCPPSGSHRYTFKIYALSAGKIEGITQDNFYDKIKPYIIDQSEIIGQYGK